MSNSNEFEARTLEEALAEASSQFGVPVDDLNYEVVSESRGFMGHPAIAVKVRVITEAAPRPARTSRAAKAPRAARAPRAVRAPRPTTREDATPDAPPVIESRESVPTDKSVSEEVEIAQDTPAADTGVAERPAADVPRMADEQVDDAVPSPEVEADRGDDARAEEDDEAGQERLDAVTRVLGSIISGMGFDLEMTGRIEDRTVVVELHGENQSPELLWCLEPPGLHRF